MDPILAEISARYPQAVEDGISYGQCLLSLRSNPKRSCLVFNLDTVAPLKKHQGALADRAAMLGNVRVDLLVFEFKQGELDAAKVQRQLEGGARLMKKILDGNNISGFVPVWVYKKIPSVTALRALQRKRVQYQPGLQRKIYTIQCGRQMQVSINSDGLLTFETK